MTLARSLGVPAVAEGIERAEQHAWLREVGCDLGQGYLFARPSTVAQLGEWMAARDEGAQFDVTRRPELLDVLPVGVGRIAARAAGSGSRGTRVPAA